MPSRPLRRSLAFWTWSSVFWFGFFVVSAGEAGRAAGLGSNTEEGEGAEVGVRLCGDAAGLEAPAVGAERDPSESPAILSGYSGPRVVCPLPTETISRTVRSRSNVLP